jgi:DNA-binding NarL/FixJ family response regulator
MTPGPGIRALIIDDQATFRSALRQALEDIPGCLVIGEGQNGLEALALVRSLQPELVIMDLHMPLMGGLEALPLLKQESPAVQVVLMTTFLDPEVRDAALDRGAAGCLEKASDLWPALRQFASALVGAWESLKADA